MHLLTLKISKSYLYSEKTQCKHVEVCGQALSYFMSSADFFLDGTWDSFFKLKSALFSRSELDVNMIFKYLLYGTLLRVFFIHLSTQEPSPYGFKLSHQHHPIFGLSLIYRAWSLTLSTEKGS